MSRNELPARLLDGVEAQEFAAVYDADGLTSLVVDEGLLILTASYVRQGPDLVLVGADGTRVLIVDFFATATPPNLYTPNGAEVSGHLASILAGPRAEGLAQAGTAQGDPIGVAEAVDGTAFVTRADGTREQLTEGTPIYEDDVVETAGNGAVGLRFEDDTTFSIGSDARMVIDDFVYDPAAGTGNALVSVLQGSFSFVSGAVADTGDDALTVQTPVLTIGIRGTYVTGRGAQEGELSEVVNLPDDNGVVGQVFVSNQGGGVTLDEAYEGTQATSQFQAPAPPRIYPAQEVESKFGQALDLLPPTPGVQRGQRDGDDDGGDDGQRGFDAPPEQEEEEPGIQTADEFGQQTQQLLAAANTVGGTTGPAPSPTTPEAPVPPSQQSEDDDAVIGGEQSVSVTVDVAAQGPGSVQYIRFTLTQPTAIVIFTDGPTTDPQIFLFEDDGSLDAADFLATDDDDGSPAGAFSNSVIETGDEIGILPAGDYILAVSDFSFSLDEAIAGANINDLTGLITVTFVIQNGRIVATAVEPPPVSSEPSEDNDVIVGSNNDDNIDALAGNDAVDGLAGNDRLIGGAGDDTIRGGDGADTLTGVDGNDLLDGGGGEDFVNFANTTTGVSANLALGSANSIGADQIGFDTLTGIENITGGIGGDSLTGDAGNNRLEGAGGNDTLNGGAGNDTLVGGTGNDALVSSAGIDVNDGGAGTDTFDLRNATIGADIDLSTGSVANDGFGSAETIANVEIVIGSDDFSDRLVFGTNSTFTGGANAGDQFVTRDGMGLNNVVTDFAAGTATDTLDVSAFAELFDLAAVQSVATDNGTDTTIQLDGDDAVILRNVQVADLVAGDFVFAAPPILSISTADLDGSNGFVVNGVNFAELTGNAINGVGDVDGDGFDDLGIGIPGGGASGLAGSGIIVFGAGGVFSPTNDTTDFAAVGGAGLTITSSSQLAAPGDDLLGFDIAEIGDVNGDGFADFAITAPTGYYGPYGYHGEGLAFVVFGQQGGLTADIDVDTLDGANGFRIVSTDFDIADLGRSISGGDVNGDGFADVIVGAPYSDYNSGSATESGVVTVIFGQSGPFGTGTVDTSVLGVNEGFTIEGYSSYDLAGFDVSARGDINGDGFADVLLGGQGLNGTGAAFVVYGSANPVNARLDSLAGAGFEIVGGQTQGDLGHSVDIIGDINGDGIDDFVVSEPQYDDAGAVNAGRAYVIFGGQAFGASFDVTTLNGTNGFTMEAYGAGHLVGTSVAGAGDVNGDGFADLIVGAPGTTVGAYVEAGQAFVVFGSDQPFNATVDLLALDGINGFSIDGSVTSQTLGESVGSLGDVNGDGFDDVGVGAPSASPGVATDEGQAFVIFGFDNGAAFSVGTSGNDTLTGDANDNAIVGGLGNDLLQGLAGADTLRGANGDDDLFGGDGNDVLLGGNGNDFLVGGAGADVVAGGAGIDQFHSESVGDLVAIAANQTVEAAGVAVDLVEDFVSGLESFTFDTSGGFGAIDGSNVNFVTIGVDYDGTNSGFGGGEFYIFDGTHLIHDADVSAAAAGYEVVANTNGRTVVEDDLAFV